MTEEAAGEDEAAGQAGKGVGTRSSIFKMLQEILRYRDQFIFSQRAHTGDSLEDALKIKNFW